MHFFCHTDSTDHTDIARRGERLPQAENLRNLCNLCDPKSTYYNSLHSIAVQRKAPIFAPCKTRMSI